jgi:5-(aminomethyl)-3-furanmethanol phosphate kinase
VIKVGGSLGARPAQLRRLMETLASAARRRCLVVVPGGGSFADEVRRADDRFALGDSAAHWMAILAMDQYGYLLARLAPGAVLARSRRELTPGQLNVLAPSAWLRRADPLPHSWDVTSDSIAAWIARSLGARRLMLVKHEDGFIGPGRGPRKMPEHARRIALEGLSGVVDPYFGEALDPAIGCWIVRGHLPHRISRLIEAGRTHGTEVVLAGKPRARTRSGADGSR